MRRLCPLLLLIAATVQADRHFVWGQPYIAPMIEFEVISGVAHEGSVTCRQQKWLVRDGHSYRQLDCDGGLVLEVSSLDFGETTVIKLLPEAIKK